jgi:hypothetical protein
LVNDSPAKKRDGNIKRNNLEELRRLCSAGNSNVKQRNAAGVIPDVAKAILPQKSIEEGATSIKQ